MNPILIIGIFVAGFLLWLLCAWLYQPIGRLCSRLISDAKNAINDNETNKEEEKK